MKAIQSNWGRSSSRFINLRNYENPLIPAVNVIDLSESAKQTSVSSTRQSSIAKIKPSSILLTERFPRLSFNYLDNAHSRLTIHPSWLAVSLAVSSLFLVGTLTWGDSRRETSPHHQASATVTTTTHIPAGVGGGNDFSLDLPTAGGSGSVSTVLDSQKTFASDSAVKHQQSLGTIIVSAGAIWQNLVSASPTIAPDAGVSYIARPASSSMAVLVSPNPPSPTPANLPRPDGTLGGTD